MTSKLVFGALAALCLTACQAEQTPQIGSSSHPDPAIEAQEEFTEQRGGEREGYAYPTNPDVEGEAGGRASAATGATEGGHTEQAGAEAVQSETTP